MSYSKTSSSCLLNNLAMRKASSSVGEYFPFSMAIIVCLVTPVLSASSCCVISFASKRSFLMLLLIKHLPILNSFAVKIDL